jgi:preprotein translocase subunit SecG
VTILLVILYVLVCLFLIMVVLLQQGKGADLAGAFGGGGSQASFGPRTGTNIMHRLTTISFVLFVVLSLSLAILSGKRHSSVMENVAVPPPAAEQNQGSELTAPAEGEVVPAPEHQLPADEGEPEATDGTADSGQ